MSQQNHETEVVSGYRVSLWLAAIGFLVLSIGSIGVGWFPTYDRFNFILQVLGPFAIAVALLLDWRTHVERRGWVSLIMFFIALVTFGALWIPYVINPASLGTASATQLGFIMAGCSSLFAAVGVFAVLSRKEAQLTHPANSADPQIKATFMQLLLFGLGALLYGVDFVWVGEEDANHAQFSLLLLSLVLILIAVISFRAHLTVQLGRPAVIVTILAILLYVMNYVIRVVPSWADEDWRLGLLMTGVAYVLGAVACALAAIHKTSASKA